MTDLRSLILLLMLGSPLAFLAGCGCNEEPPEPPTPAPQQEEATYDRGYYLDMALDSQGRVWLAYQDREVTSLNVARGTGDPIEFTHWQVEGQGEVVGGILTGNYDAGNYASIAIDGSDRPHVAHWDRDGDRLKYAVREGDGWATGNASSEGGQFASIGLIGGTDPVVAFYADNSLMVAWKSGDAWDDEVVDEGTAPDVPEGDPEIDPDVGQFADLLVGSDGTVWIAYYDAANGDLKVASGSPGSWDVETWASEGDVGAWPNLSEHAGSVYVAFMDNEAKDLWFGRWSGSALDASLVDDGDFIGADSSTTWAGDTVAIMYHDGVENDAVLAVDDGTGWVIDTHMADGAVGFHNTLIAGASGQLHWAGFNHTTTDIEFQRFGL